MDCELSRSSLNDQLTALEAAQLIRREAGRDEHTKRQRPTHYRFAFEDDFAPAKGDRQESEPSPEIGHGAESESGAEPSPKNGESRVRNSDSNLVREPVREPVERESARETDLAQQGQAPVGASAGEASRADDGKSAKGRTVKSFMLAWPSAGVDSRAKIETAWKALSPADRDKALDHVEAFLEEFKRVGRGKLPAGWTYLGDRPWEIAAAKAEASPAVEARPDSMMVERFSRAWWFVLWRAIREGNFRRARIDIGLAVAGTSTVARGEVKEALEAGADADLTRLSIADDRAEIELWRRRLFDRHRLRMPVPDVAPYLWVPARHPDELRGDDAVEEVPL